MKHTLKFAAIGLFLGLPFAATADTLNGTCTSNHDNGDNTMLCQGDPVFYTLQSDGVGTTYWIELRAPAEHCSRVSYAAVLYDENQYLGKTAMLAGTESEYITVGNTLAAGPHRIEIQATGEVGGCNTGTLASWGVEATAVVAP